MLFWVRSRLKLLSSSTNFILNLTFGLWKLNNGERLCVVMKLVFVRDHKQNAYFELKSINRSLFQNEIFLKFTCWNEWSITRILSNPKTLSLYLDNKNIIWITFIALLTFICKFVITLVHIIYLNFRNQTWSILKIEPEYRYFCSISIHGSPVGIEDFIIKVSIWFEVLNIYFH